MQLKIEIQLLASVILNSILLPIFLYGEQCTSVPKECIDLKIESNVFAVIKAVQTIKGSLE